MTCAGASPGSSQGPGRAPGRPAPGEGSRARAAWRWIWYAGSVLLIAAGGLLVLAMMSLLFQRSSPGATIRLRNALLWACLLAAVSGYVVRLLAAFNLAARRRVRRLAGGGSGRRQAGNHTASWRGGETTRRDSDT